MKSIVLSIALAAAMAVFGAVAPVLPQVGDGTEPNQWTRNVEGVLSAAKTTNLPILLVMINDSSRKTAFCGMVAATRNTGTMESRLIRRKVKMLLTRFAAMPVTKKGTKTTRDRRKTSV